MGAKPLHLTTQGRGQKCLLLNPYTRTLKPLTIPQNRDNWYAILGTNRVEQFYLEDNQGTACLYSDDFHADTVLQATRFKDWVMPIIGILLFVGPPDGEGDTTSITDAAITLLEAEFKTARFGNMELLR